MADNGLSVVAVDEASGRVVGVWAVYDQGDINNIGFCNYMSFMCSMTRHSCSRPDLEGINISDQIKEPIIREHDSILRAKRLTRGVAVEMLAVATHEDFGNRGIGGNMTKLLL